MVTEDDMKILEDVSPWLPFETRRRDRDIKREAVLRTAVQLFLKQGYHRATLNDVAERLNITKPALYTYFRGKDEILLECWAVGQRKVFECIARIELEGGEGLAKLRKLVLAYAEIMTTDYGRGLVRFDIRDLADRHAGDIRAGKRRIDTTFRQYIGEGLSDGSILPCDAKLTAFAVAGSLNWIGHWYQPDGELTPQDIAESFAQRLVDSLATRPQQ